MHDRPSREPERTVVIHDGLGPHLSGENAPVEGDTPTITLDEVLPVAGPAPGEVDRPGDGGRGGDDGGGGDDPAPASARESLLARRAKFVALLFVTAALVASVIVASSLSGSADESDDAGAGTRHRHEITGAAALGGFTLPPGERRTRDTGVPDTPASSPPARSPDTADSAEPTDSPGSDHSVRSAEATTGDSPAPEATDPVGAAVPTGTAGTPGNGLRSGPADAATGLVHAFYERVRTAPEQALGLLAPALTAGEGHALLASWRSLTHLEIEDVRERGDGTVRVVVRMTPDGGAPLRITQLLGVDAGPDPLINRAILLSVRAVG
ncbi:hypothetical protein [Saccharomonospora iraqiensis]|uniref:hypothetical protein n=1 Tax=Saccharomonospora iraqiensis TaxID=52698 RepID=UPI0004041135|nr:hypothetical protein [Saccharomonospora iraqiensis]